ncbi:MAG: hypothetical protein ACRD1P_07320 [Thermoanaerobaculia bacterium]
MMTRTVAVRRIEEAGLPADQCGLAIDEAVGAVRYYARTGEWPKNMTCRTWVVVRTLPLLALAQLAEEA